MSTEAAATATTPAADTAPALSSASGTTVAKPKAKRTRKARAVKRRGARVEEDEGEEGGTAASDGAPSDSDGDESDSDFSAASEDEEDDEEEDEPEKSGEVSKAPAFADSSAVDPPSWADAPAGDDSSLPTLEFSQLSTSDALPTESTSAPTDKKTESAVSKSSRQQQIQAKREALKARDPAAYAEAEKLRIEKKKAKSIRSRERKKEKALAAAAMVSTGGASAEGIATEGTGAAVEPTSSSNAPPAPAADAAPPVAAKKRERAPRKPKAVDRTSSAATPSDSNPTPSSQPQQQSPRPPVIANGAPPSGPQSAAYLSAREAYTTRLAEDPAYIPRVGRFWSHDDRLAAPEVRALNPFWRGRGGVRGRGGFVGARGGEGGRFGPAGGALGGWGQEGEASGVPPHLGGKKAEAEVPKSEESKSQGSKQEEGDAEVNEDDRWGRGEAKRVQRPAVNPTLPAWSHDGFQELEAAPPPPRRNGGRRNGPAVTGPPGSINPQFAHLPFHPRHRFPAAPQTTTKPGDGEAEPESGAALPNVVLPPSSTPASAASPASGSKVEQEQQTAADESSFGVVVNLGGKRHAQPVTVFPPPRDASAPPASLATSTASAPSASGPIASPSLTAGTSILYAADPGRHLRESVVASNPEEVYQLPPHLQHQQQQQHFQQGAYIPRHASPAYYPHFYSPDAFPSMPTPGATPPPLFHPGQQQQLFAPPRTSKIEIKAPGPPTPKLSAAGETFQPRSTPPVFHPSQQQLLQQQQFLQQQQQQMYAQGGTVYYPQAEYYGAPMGYTLPGYPGGMSQGEMDPAILQASYYGGRPGQQYYAQNGQPMWPPLAFADNEKVLCFHGPLMYEAKINKTATWTAETSENGEVGPHYFVHYKGWKQTWDEWVSEERLKKYNEENIKKQRALMDAQRAREQAERAALAKAAEAESSRKNAQPGAATGSAPPTAGRREEKRGQKRGRDVDGEEEYMKRPEIKIAIPDVLKSQLVDDWEAITKNAQLVNLPRDPNVDTIINEWNKFHQNEEPETRRLTAEVSAGLRLYFNKALGNNLLYRFERGQYAEQMKRANDEDVELSSIYGAEHLLRLFVNLPELLAHTAMDPDTVTVLKAHMSAFLNWMTLNRHMLFSPSYNNSSTGYQNNNRA